VLVLSLCCNITELYYALFLPSLLITLIASIGIWFSIFILLSILNYFFNLSLEEPIFHAAKKLYE